MSKAKPEMTTVTVNCTRELRDKLKQHAAENGVSLSKEAEVRLGRTIRWDESGMMETFIQTNTRAAREAIAELDCG